MILFHLPGREVALGRVDQTGVGRTIVLVHGDLGAGGLHRRQGADLVERPLPGLAPGETAVDGDGAAVRHGAAAWRSEEDLGDGQGALAEEVVVAEVVAEFLQFAEDRAHLEDGVVTALRRGAVAADPLNFNADLHAATLATVDLAVGRFGTDHELGADLALLDDVLPAEAVAILLLHGAGHQQGVLVFQSQILDDLAGVDHGGHAPFLIGGTATADDLVIFHPLIGVEGPVGHVADPHGIDVGIHGDQVRAVANIAQHVAHGVDLDLVKADFFHFLLDAQHDALFIAALTRDGDHVAQELSHLGLVLVGLLQHHFKRNLLAHCVSP